jgi:hypothetical protein
MSDAPPTWSAWSEVPRVVLHRPHLRKTIQIALVVGTVLFGINQLDVVWSGRANAVVWVKIALTYCVPFVVSNIGVLIGSRRR